MPLLSTHHSSGSSLKVSLHPLVLLTISDHITRHALRHSNGVIVGALLGQQSGRNITLEYAFECNTITSEFKPDEIILHDAWFKERLQQYKDVHKEPALELVGWFTTAPSSGPEAVHLPIHQQILQNYNETAVLLCIHPQNVADGKAGGGKLPLTIYESVHESGELGEKGGMEIDGDPHENARLDLRFRELAYNIETGEAEMIGVDFVAKGGGNATAVETGIHTSQTQANGKGKGTVREAKIAEEVSTLSVEDEERESAPFHPLYNRTPQRQMISISDEIRDSNCLSLCPCKCCANVTHENQPTEILPDLPSPILSHHDPHLGLDEQPRIHTTA